MYSDPIAVERQGAAGRNVRPRDPNDPVFRDRVRATHTLELAILTLPNLAANLGVLDQLEAGAFDGRIAAVASHPDEIEALEQAGVSTVFNALAETGAGFAAHVSAQTPSLATPQNEVPRPA